MDAKARADALNLLARASAAFPELRLCQIIANALHTEKDVFYVTDDDLALKLTKYIEWQNAQQEALNKWHEEEKKNSKTTKKTDSSNIF